MLFQNENSLLDKNKPMLMPYEGENVPHILIEVNQKCNISCTACYKDKSSYTKSYEQIIKEIDLACKWRKLSLISFAGGEPTLHPDLDKIINYVHKKNIQTQILSNGLTLTNELLKKYKEAGLTQVYLHVDSYQKRSDLSFQAPEDEVNKLRETIAKRIQNNNLGCALSVTLYPKQFTEIKKMIDFIIDSKYYQRVLVTLCHDFCDIAEKLGHLNVTKMDKNLIGEKPILNTDVKRKLFNLYGMLPYAYIGSELDSKDQRWLLYYTMVIYYKNKKQVLHFDDKFQNFVKVLNFIGNKVEGKYPFGQMLSKSVSIILCLAYAFLSFKITTILKTFKFLSYLLIPGSSICQKSFCFQEPPNITKDGEINYCKACPDATIRNGKLTPVCTADFVEPVQ